MSARHDTLSRMVLTLVCALLAGVVFEAEGLRIWADRLPVGWLRSVAQPATAGWYALTLPLHVSAPRQWALQGKASLASAMLQTPTVAPAPASAPVAAQSTAPGDAGTVALALATSLAASSAPSVKPLAPPVSAASAPAHVEGAQTVRVSAEATMVLPPLGLSREVHVALAGDSMMAVGLAPTLTRGLSPEKNVHLLRAYRSGTGLARPEVFDWLVEYPRMVGQVKPELVICAMGGNDAQNVQVGKQVLQYGSPEWDEFFRQRLSAYLDMLTREHARVLWLGMPVMKANSFSQKMAHMNEVVRNTVARYPEVTWLDMNPPLGYAKQGFEQYRANDKGKLIKLRADDGIHLTDDGASYLLMPIRDWLARAAVQSDPESARKEVTSMLAPVARQN